MKKLFNKTILIFLSVCLTISLYAQWNTLPIATTIDLNSAVQITEKKAFIVGDDGTAISTNNNGSSWNPLHLGIRSNLNSIKFIDSYNGFIVGDNGVILKTDSCWRNWEVISVASNYFNNDVSFTNKLNGIVVGYKILYNKNKPQSLAMILVTNDGGLTWSERTSTIPGKFNSVIFFDKDYAIAVGDAGLVAVTYDHGENWDIRRISSYNLNEVKVCKSGVKIIVGENGTIFISKEEDRYRWIDYSINTAYNIKSVCMRSSDTFVMAGEKKCILNNKIVYLSVILESKELNGFWNLVYANMGGTFNSINFCNVYSAIAVGQKGTVAVFHQAIAQDTLLVVDSPAKIETQNYPNPFNPSTLISFTLPEQANVELKIYDVLGNEVATLVNETKPSGDYEVEWNASNMPSGVYIYQLRVGTSAQIKKMLLLK